MTPVFESLIAATQAATLLAGGFVTLLAVRAYRRTGATSLRALAVGLGLVTGGAIIGGVVHHIGEQDLVTAVAVQSTAMAMGFTVLAYSLYANGSGGGGGTWQYRPWRRQ